MKNRASKMIVGILISIAAFSLFFQNCAKKLVSSSASLIAETELQNTYAIADFDFIDVKQDKTVFDSTSTILNSFVSSADTQDFKFQWKMNGKELPGQTAKTLVLSNLNINHSGYYSVVVKTVVAADKKLRNAETELAISNLVVEPKPLISTPVEITAQSHSVKLQANSATYLFVQHKEYPAASVQWFKDGEMLAGATAEQLVFSKVIPENEGIYYAEISNSVGKVKSQEILLLVETPLGPPVLRKAASNQELALGQPLSLFIEVLSPEAITYQWFKDGVLLSGEKSAKLQIRNTLNSDEGVYKVVASTASGVTEKVFEVTVFDQIHIQTPLVDQDAIGVGKRATFSTTLSGDITAVEWYKNDVRLPNQAQLSLILNTVQIADEATYKVIAKNPFGQVTQSANLTVVRPPQVISEVTGRQLLYSSQSEVGSILMISAGVQGDSLDYQWFFKPLAASDFAAISGAKSAIYSKTPLTESDSGSYKLVVTNISGSVNSTIDVKVIDAVRITQPLVNDRIGISVEPYRLMVKASASADKYKWTMNGVQQNSIGNSLDFIPSTAGDFKFVVEVTDLLGGVATSSATISVIPKPTMVFGPSDRTDYAGANFSLSCTASGSDLTYQWYKDDVMISGATTNVYTISNAQIGQSGVYKIVVTNPSGSVSDPATVTIKPATAPLLPALANRSIEEGDTLTVTASATGNNPITYRWYKNDVAMAAMSPTLTITPVSSADAGIYKMIATNSIGSSSTSFTLTVTPPLAPKINSQSSSIVNVFVEYPISLSVSATGVGATYRWYKDNIILPAYASSNLYLSSPKITDSGSYRVEVINAVGSATATFDVIVKDYEVPYFTSHINDQALLLNESISLSASATGGGIKYRWFKDNVVIPGATASYYTKKFESTADSGLYKLEASNNKGTVYSFSNVTLRLEGGPKPSIYSNVNFYEGDYFMLSTTVTAGNPVTYDWYKDNIRMNVDTNSYSPKDASGNSRTALISDSGEYKIVVSNAVGSATTRSIVTVKAKMIPKIITTNFNYSFKVGDYFSLYVQAEGGALSYKWYKDGVLMPGVASSSINGYNDLDPSSSNFTAIGAGNYRVEVSNSMGMTPANFIVTVKP